MKNGIIENCEDLEKIKEIKRLKQENQQLKGLLKECRYILNIEKDFASCCFEKYKLEDLLTKINNIVGDE